MPIKEIDISDDEVEQLLLTPENHFVDMKAIEIAPASVTKLVSAFANTSGGELFIGIDERIGRTGPERAWRGFANQEAVNGLIQALEKMSPLGNHYTVDLLLNKHQKRMSRL